MIVESISVLEAVLESKAEAGVLRKSRREEIRFGFSKAQF